MSVHPPAESFIVDAPLRASGGGMRIAPLCVAAVLIFALLVARDVAGSGFALSIGGEALWGRDFVNVHSSGLLALQGKLGILYDVEAYRAFQAQAYDSGLRGHNYSYPPVTLLYTWLFALLPYPVAALAWLGGTAALFVAAARPYLVRASLPAWIALLAPASLMNVWAGHYGFLIGALWLAAFYHLPRRPLLAGVLLGLMIVKPHLAVLAPLILLARREWGAIAAAALTAAGLALLSAVLFGADLWVTYLTETSRVQAAMVDDTRTFFITMMPTLTPALVLAGLPLAAAGVCQAAVALGAVALLLKRLPTDSMDAGLAGAAATFLVLPYGFAYDMTAAGLGALLLYRRAPEGPRRTVMLMVALVPMSVLLFNAAALPLAPALIAAQLFVALGLRRERAATPGAPAYGQSPTAQTFKKDT
jgi:hypothetical protein